MGVDHGKRGTSPQNLEWGMLMQAVPPDFVIGTKRSVLWPSIYAKIRFRRPGLCPGPRWGSSRRSPRSSSRLGGDTPPHNPSHSAPTLAMRHQNSPRSTPMSVANSVLSCVARPIKLKLHLFDLLWICLQHFDLLWTCCGFASLLGQGNNWLDLNKLIYCGKMSDNTHDDDVLFLHLCLLCHLQLW